MSIQLKPIGTFETGVFDESAAEIVAHDSATQRLFVVNANQASIDVLDLKNPANPIELFKINVTPYGAVANSVTVANGIVAIAVENQNKQAAGSVVFFDTNGQFLKSVPVGALPDMVTFTPDGTKVLVANEGEPSDDYKIDPEGSVSIIDITAGVANATVKTADFTRFNSKAQFLRQLGIGIYGPNATVAQDLEPEYIAVSPDNSTAWITLQENNAIAKLNIASGQITQIIPLRFKSHAIAANTIDASDKDNGINLQNWPIFSAYQPDSIATFTANGQTYLITANEGDTRAYTGFSEETRVADLTLDPTRFPNATQLKAPDALGRLTVTKTFSDADGDGDTDSIITSGSRSFSIFDANGNLVFDSGDDLEQILAKQIPFAFNSNGDRATFDTRSDNRGPEPEGVDVGVINGRTYAFIGLERASGLMVYDITNPTAPQFIQYTTNNNFNGQPSNDLSPEGIKFIPANKSPNGKPLVAVGNEVSGSTTLYEAVPAGITRLQILHASDLEGGVDAITDAPNFAAAVEALEDDAANQAIPSILLSAGDNYLPGPFFSAAGDASVRTTLQTVYTNFFGLPANSLSNLREGSGRIDISNMNIIGFDASALGNHEFDPGTSTLQEIIDPEIRGKTLADVRWVGTQFPYLSANLDFSKNNLSAVYTPEILSNVDFESTPFNLTGANNAPKIAPATIIERNGDRIGVVGATTPLLASISSPGSVGVGGNGNDMAALAGLIQPTIDRLLAQGVNKIITVTHLQQFQLEQELIPRLRGVDVAIAGGSDTIVADANDRLRSGDTAGVTPYPFITKNADGQPAAIVSTDGEYSYVGRLVVDFDANGVLIPSSINPNVSGAYAADAQGVQALWTAINPGENPFGDKTKGGAVRQLTQAVQGVVTAKDAQVFGSTKVFLEGSRSVVRTQESNLGNLTADANLFVAQQVDPSVRISIKNGGGIRAVIGEVIGNAGETVPPQANPLSGKKEGQVSQLDIENSLRFNNKLTLLTLTAAQLEQAIEHGVAATAPGQTPGQFPQVGGMAFSFDPSLPAGSRVQSLAITDETGKSVETVVQNGQLVGDPNRTFRVVTLNFLAGGGDNYPFPSFAPNSNVVNLETGEQEALGRYLQQLGTFSSADTALAKDTRIQNLSARSDTVLSGVGIADLPPLELEVDPLTGIQLKDLFDEAFYASNNPDVAAAIAAKTFDTGFDHFTEFGQEEGRDPSQFFDTDFYLRNNPDVAAAVAEGTVTAIEHYVQFGEQELRDPSPSFNNRFYLANNLDVFEAVQEGGFASPIEHFIKFGRAEGRRGSSV
jgi:2',3'-cyclic-nucleotide 2'-phosphodiesterase / 3'-nucleotidase / 5'-nucleotidase